MCESPTRALCDDTFRTITCNVIDAISYPLLSTKANAKKKMRLTRPRGYKTFFHAHLN